MNKIIDTISKEVEKEFPSDPALQQVHIARKLIADKAENLGMSLFDYFVMQEKEIFIKIASLQTK